MRGGVQVVIARVPPEQPAGFCGEGIREVSDKVWEVWGIHEIPFCASVLVEPDGLGEGAVGGDVPEFEADPFFALEVGGRFEGSGAELAGVGEVDALALGFLAVAGDEFGEGEGEGPFEFGFDGDGGEIGLAEGVAAFFAADGDAREEVCRIPVNSLRVVCAEVHDHRSKHEHLRREPGESPESEKGEDHSDGPG